MTEAVQAALEKNTIKGLIIDVRNNPGGVMNASVEMASNFLDGGLVVYTKGRHPESMNTYNAEPGELIADVPIVVLVNGGSASASEIVAGALQDRGRAVIMGTQSFGKGSVQTVLPVSETKALKLTTSLYYTPSGRSIQAEGIIPDVVVERAQLTSLEQKGRLRESDLNRSIENKGSEAETETEAIASLREDDNQVYEAFTLLKGINVYQSLASESVDSGANSQAGTSETPKKVSTD